MQYIETSNESKIIELLAKINAHLTAPATVVDIMKHLTEEKWAINSDLVIETIGKKYKTIREQEIGEFVGINADVYYCEYESDIGGGYDSL